MKKLLFFLCLIPSLSFADSKISALNNDLTPANTDYLPILSNSSASNQKVTIANLLNVGATNYVSVSSVVVNYVNYSSAAVSYLAIASAPVSTDGLTKSSASVSYLGISTNSFFSGIFISTSLTTGSVFSIGTSSISARGTTDGSDAEAGKWGEIISTGLPRSTGRIMTVSNAFYSISTVTVSAGDWTLNWSCGFNNGNISTGQSCCISQTQDACCNLSTCGSIPNTLYEMQLRQGVAGLAGDDYQITGIPYRIKLSAPTIFYLVGQVGYSGGTTRGYGSMIFTRNNR